MKKFSSYVLVGVLFLLFNQCNEGAESAKNTPSAQPSIFEKAVFDPQLGAKHNAILKDVLANANISEDNDYPTNLANMNSYFARVYKVDVSQIPDQFFTSKGSADGRRTLDDFDPIAYVDKYQHNYSPLFASTLKQVIRDVQAASTQGLSGIQRVVGRYIAEVKAKKFSLSQGEANELLNILTVMSSSASFWHDYLGLGSATSVSLTQAARRFDGEDDDAWKIAAADGIEGLAGGLLGGPVGAAIGLASGSATMWIGLL